MKLDVVDLQVDRVGIGAGAMGPTIVVDMEGWCAISTVPTIDRRPLLGCFVTVNRAHVIPP
ncbi:hypothetical protein [Pseudorhodoferax aquiterrae]|uniref:hypothetical protein n=1 Tax=Pseudorhodoferax aquiterrae TaxID=747304 RepID=UPI001679B0D1|nr:hypothetical protein [Pseudorhodoferax aquiterrae]